MTSFANGPSNHLRPTSPACSFVKSHYSNIGLIQVALKHFARIRCGDVHVRNINRSSRRKIYQNTLNRRVRSDCVASHALKGTYIDLGHINEPDDSNFTAFTSNSQVIETAEEVVREWRSKHWIVLIDDESSIRLAIGDYLHSMGYRVVTACDGPMSFLELLLWTCGWSFSGNNLNISNNNECPPWIEDSHPEEHPWRLPSIIISDIRMPGGIDGVQLLELLRQQGSMGFKPKQVRKIDSNTRIKKRRGRKAKSQTFDDDYDDATDETQYHDPKILAGWVELTTPIATPIDHAKKVLDAIDRTLDYCKKTSSQGNNYPDQIQDIPVILLTAKAMVSDRIKGYKAGADGYLPKPFRPEELLRMVDNLLRRQDREQSAQLANALHKTVDDNYRLDSHNALSVSEMDGLINELLEIKELLRDVTPPY